MHKWDLYRSSFYLRISKNKIETNLVCNIEIRTQQSASLLIFFFIVFQIDV